jgi:hypothetical protein
MNRWARKVKNIFDHVLFLICRRRFKGVRRCGLLDQNFCLGFDHRTIDGADAGKFMAEFKKTLEGWTSDIGA